jgi:exonuclease VII large subunit
MEKNCLSRVFNFEKDVCHNVEIIDSNLENRLIKFESAIDKQLLKLDNIDVVIDKKKNILEKLSITLDNYNPEKIAKMGYSKVIKNGKAITSIKDISSGDDIKVSIIDGRFDCKVY